MPRSLFLLLPLLLTACPADDKATDAATDDTGATDGCTVQVDGTIPTSGSVSADYRAAIEFELSAADPTAEASSDIAGTSVRVDGDKRVVFTPSAPLEPNTSYTVTLDYCGGSVPLGFTTGELGGDLTTDLVGKTYALALADARIVEPAGVGSILSTYITQDILVGVVSTDGGQLEMIGAIGKEDANPPAQDYCDPTIDFPVADFSDSPYFSVGPQDTTLSVAGLEITIGRLEITGTFSPDGSYFGGGTLAGTIDTRPLVPLLDEEGSDDAICDLAGNFGAACTTCPSDGQPYCLTLVADQIVAEEVSGVTLTEVTGNNCEGCESGPPAEDAICEE